MIGKQIAFLSLFCFISIIFILEEKIKTATILKWMVAEIIKTAVILFVIVGVLLCIASAVYYR